MAIELEEARSVEIEARLAVRTSEERVNSVRGKADSLRRAAVAEREARARAARLPRHGCARRPSPRPWPNRDAWWRLASSTWCGGFRTPG
ncbi:hypothetical protein [Mycobacteroides abscessus]|uniref:hypothetical protein n=1 Tax=Mycobacteroides abscessus TaxID=36809 RepID=UPI001F5FF4FA|nr:hypothetical protein [Mycobacteroides abscessus]